MDHYQLKQRSRAVPVLDRPFTHCGPPSLCPAPRAAHLLLAAMLYTLLAIYGSLVPLQYEPMPWAEAVAQFRQIPFLQLSIENRADWVANILLFVPLSFLWLGACCVDRSRHVAWLLGPVVIVAGAVLSLLIEFAQSWFPIRTVSQNDILAETLGAVGGVGLWIAIGQPCVTWLREYAADFRAKRRLDWFLQLYAAGFFIHAVMPLDLTISLAEIYDKVQEGRVLLIPFSYGYETTFDLAYGLVTDVLVFVPVGAWLASAYTSRYQPVRSFGTCLLLSLLAAGLVECCQLFVYSRYVDTTDIVTSTVGGLAGAILMQTLGRRHASAHQVRPVRRISRAVIGWSAAAICYAGILLLLFWNPFDFSWDAEQAKLRWEDFFRVPFAALYYGTEFHALQQVLRKVLLFAPLGAVLAQITQLMAHQRAPRMLLLGLFLAMCFSLAMLIEMGQLLLPSHIPDLTDALLCTAGAAAGMWIRLSVLSTSTVPHRVLNAASE